MMYSPKAQTFVNLLPKQWAIASWNRVAPYYARDWIPVLNPLHRIIARQCLDELQGEEYPSILDVGSAAGEPSLSLARANPNAEILSSDIAASNTPLGQARARKGNIAKLLNAEILLTFPHCRQYLKCHFSIC